MHILVLVVVDISKERMIMKNKLIKTVIAVILISLIPSLGFAKTSKKNKVVKRNKASEDASAFEEPIVKKNIEIKDSQWGTLYIETTDYHEPANFSVEVDVYVQCKDQSINKKTLNPPKKEVLIHQIGLCEYKGHKFDKNEKKLTVFFNKDSGLGDSYEELCNIEMAQDVMLKQVCSKWAPKNK